MPHRRLTSGRDLLRSLLVQALRWVVVGGVASVVVVALLSGVAAAVAAFLGVVLVVLFYGVDIVVVRVTRRRPGAVTAALLVLDYLVKVAVLAIAVWQLRLNSDLDMTSLAIGAVVTTVCFVAGLTTAAIRTPSFAIDDVAQGDGSHSADPSVRQERTESPVIGSSDHGSGRP